MRPFIVGDVLRVKSRPLVQYEILEYSSRIKLRKVGCDGVSRKNSRGIPYPLRPIGDEFEVNASQFNPSYYELVASKPFTAETKTNVVEFTRPKNKCGCDCGGFAVYQSEASHCHSSWCYVNRKAI